MSFHGGGLKRFQHLPLCGVATAQRRFPLAVFGALCPTLVRAQLFRSDPNIEDTSIATGRVSRFEPPYRTCRRKPVCRRGPGSIRFGSVRFDSVQFDSILFGSLRPGSVSTRFDLVRPGSRVPVRPGSVRFGAVRRGSFRYGAVRFAQPECFLPRARSDSIRQFKGPAGSHRTSEPVRFDAAILLLWLLA